MERMPVLFVGHGSPMNAIDDNEWSRGFQRLAKLLPEPKAILSISAHWYVPGTFLTGDEHPRTIHDFGGFPRELYEQQYPAPGSIELAKRASKLVGERASLRTDWGLDHGTWTVLKYLRPAAVKAGVIKEGEKVRFGFHNFRHALATALVKLKVEAKTVQGMLRHEDFGTTMQLYPQSDMESMREAQGKFLEQLLGDRIHLLTERSKHSQYSVPTSAPQFCRARLLTNSIWGFERYGDLSPTILLRYRQLHGFHRLALASRLPLL